MYKKILTIFALAASLLACNKVENEVVAPENGAKTLTITATIGDPDTRLSYSEATDGSYKARFNENDVVWAYFAKADNSVAGPVTKLAIDPKSISFDGKTACFRQPAVSIPEGSTKIIAYLANTANTTNFDGGDDIVSDISSQANLTAALNNQVIYGAVDFKDLTSTNPDALAASIPFSYKTSLLKFSLALPEGTEVDPKAAVSVNLTSGKIHNKLHISGGVLGTKSEEGDLNLGATVANGVVTAYAAVWAADDLNSKIFVTIDKDSFLADFKPSATIAAGKAYTVERAVTKVSMETKWIADEAGSVEFPNGGAAAVTEGFLSYADGKISWTKNETGKPRSAKLVFANGSTFEVLQIGPADFKGAWTFTTKVFAQAGSFVPAKDPYTFGDVTLGEPRNTEALVAPDGKTYTNNIGVKGLFFDTVLDACLDIDYEAKTLRMGLFLDTRDGIGQQVNGKYATYFPGLATKSATAWGKPWLYTETDLGDPDYVWMWFKISEDFNTIIYQNRTTADVELQTLTQYSDKSMNQICGFGVVLSNTNAFNHSTVNAYANFFQCNPVKETGEFFTRK
ncbi:MAG: hypothetical protein SOZ87_04980 [Candidatus Cryptobacteroides sp.]|nr:hypothetical protein [Candidatus Cryptobacteroides sp.]